MLFRTTKMNKSFTRFNKFIAYNFNRNSLAKRLSIDAFLLPIATAGTISFLFYYKNAKKEPHTADALWFINN